MILVFPIDKKAALGITPIAVTTETDPETGAEIVLEDSEFSVNRAGEFYTGYRQPEPKAQQQIVLDNGGYIFATEEAYRNWVDLKTDGLKNRKTVAVK